MTQRVLCTIISRHPERVPSAAPSLLVCRGHASKLADMVEGIVDLAADLTAAHSAATGMSDKVSHTSDPGLKFNPEVAIASAQLHRVSLRWARAIATQRSLTSPANNLVRLVDVIRKQLDWLLAQPEVAEFHDELEAVLWNARSLAYPSGRRRFDILMPGGTPARCLGPVACNVLTRTEIPCSGTLTAVVAPADELLPSWIECNGCGAHIDSTRWLAYGNKLHKQAAEAS